jgi:hypothetical protein
LLPLQAPADKDPTLNIEWERIPMSAKEEEEEEEEARAKWRYTSQLCPRDKYICRCAEAKPA